MRRLTAQSGLLVLTLAVCVLGLPGCANCRLPQIDPSGENLFVTASSNPQAAFRELPATNKEPHRVELILGPRETVAPIGSEVILLAGVRGPDEYLRTNERIEWMIEPTSVGQFVDFDKGSWTDPLVGDFTRAKKIDNNFAVNTTSRRLLTLTRGTPGKDDDLNVLKGQAWVTLTSPVEGTSQVTAYCPGVLPWEARTETCQVHWIDAQWTFPSVAIAESGGRQLLTTTVSRQSDCAPRGGWIVTYEIVDGPPAGFAPDGSQKMEIPTDAQGKASVELFQKEARAGTSKIAIQVVRPAGLGCPEKRIVIGKTCLAQTWSAPDLGVRVTGPTVGSVGSNLPYRIEVSNPGDMPADGISLSVPMPPGLGYVSASPTSEGTGGDLRWMISRLAPGEVRSIALDLRAERSGSFELCANAVASSGLSARACANLSVEAAELTVEIRGATEATVGESVTHRIVVTNAGRVPATGLILTDIRDAGLEHNISERKIETSLGTLGPQQYQEVTVTFRAAVAGRQCHTVQVTGPGGLQADSRACIDVREAAAPPLAQPPRQPQPAPGWNEPEPSPLPLEPQPAPKPAFEIRARFAPEADPGQQIDSASGGDEVLLICDILSADQQAIGGLEIRIEMGGSLRPLLASDGNKREGDALVWRNQSVPADTVGRFAVKCLCQTASPNVCFRAVVTDVSGATQQQEVCIPVYATPSQPAAEAPPMVESPPEVPTQTGVTVDVNTTHNPVNLGSTFIYRVRVTNLSASDIQDAKLRVAFQPGLRPLRWQTFGDTTLNPGNNMVDADPIPLLRAGSHADYQINVSADQIGQYEVRAEVTSPSLSAPVSDTDLLQVNARF